MLILKPDKKGRITLGDLAKGISSFKVEQSFDGKIILDPQVEISKCELQRLIKPKKCNPKEIEACRNNQEAIITISS